MRPRRLCTFANDASRHGEKFCHIVRLPFCATIPYRWQICSQNAMSMRKKFHYDNLAEHCVAYGMVMSPSRNFGQSFRLPVSKKMLCVT